MKEKKNHEHTSIDINRLEQRQKLWQRKHGYKKERNKNSVIKSTCIRYTYTETLESNLFECIKLYMTKA